ncbi:MAG: hypothetical protein A2166_06465 [Omnitrophica WOR_2 bacterium RBG_13_41_10]|nr:MAG: hypothetical protein A2166_06465 [Omnitrophica WOR_2 bacterium RBG_13_41_10]
MTKVMLVDDEVDFCGFLESILTKEGYEVVVANSGMEAIEKVKTENPQIILLDVRMPGMDGLQVLEKIRQIDKEAIIIMVTVVTDIDVAKKSMKLGSINYLTKPIDLGLLKRNLRGWATQIEAQKLNKVDIVFLGYDQEKFNTALDLFAKKGFNIKYIEEKTAAKEVAKGYDLLVIRADLMGSNAIEILAQYKQAYPKLPAMIVINTEIEQELIDKIKPYGAYQYIRGPYDTYTLILIIYRMVARFHGELKEAPEAEKPSDYIFIVDDEPDVCEYLAKFLTKEGYKVCAISDPKTVLAQVEALRPAIVLLDIVMPYIDGLELLKKIKKSCPQTQVIMITGVKDENICKECIESGACDYLVKPFSLDQVKMIILTALIKSRK